MRALRSECLRRGSRFLTAAAALCRSSATSRHFVLLQLLIPTLDRGFEDAEPPLKIGEIQPIMYTSKQEYSANIMLTYPPLALTALLTGSATAATILKKEEAWEGSFNITTYGVDCTDENYVMNATEHAIKFIGNGTLCETNHFFGLPLNSHNKIVVEKCGDTQIEGFEDGILMNIYGCADSDCKLCEGGVLGLGYQFTAVSPKKAWPRVPGVCYGLYPSNITGEGLPYLDILFGAAKNHLKYSGKVSEIAGYNAVYMNTCMGEYYSNEVIAVDKMEAEDENSTVVDGTKIMDDGTSAANWWNLSFLGGFTVVLSAALIL